MEFLAENTLDKYYTVRLEKAFTFRQILSQEDNTISLTDLPKYRTNEL